MRQRARVRGLVGRGLARWGLLAALLAALLSGCGGDGGGGEPDAGSDAAATDLGRTDGAGPADVPGGPDAADVTEDTPGVDVPPEDAGADVPPDDAGTDAPQGLDVPPDVPVVDPCDPNPCVAANRGVCDPSDEAPGYTCTCDLGFVEDPNGDCVPDTDVCETAADCDDGRYCNGPEDCAPDAPGAAPNGCVAGADPTDDDDPCTTDACDEETDQVTHTPRTCPTNAHCEADADGEPACVCDDGYEFNEAGLCRACESDPQEPNDSEAEARPLTGAIGQRLTSDPTNPDWFTVPVCAGGTVTVELYFDDREGNIDAFLLDVDGETVLAAGDSVTADERLVWTSDRDGAVLLQVVMPDGNCTRYSASYLLEGCAPCADDAFEPNGSRAAATPVESALDTPLVLISDNADFYSVFACEGQQLRFDVTYDRGVADLRVRLLGESSDAGLAAPMLTPDGQFLEWVATAAGTYYLAVDTATLDACLDYRIALDKGSCVAPCEADAFEENDTPETAAALTAVASDSSSGAVVELGVLSDDEDWYAVSLCAGENLRVTARATFDEAAARLQLTAFAADGTTLLTEGTPGTAPWVDVTTIADETVHIRVTTTRETCDPYRILVERTGCRVCEDDEGEDDDTSETARAMVAAEQSTGVACGGDDDWFVVELCEATATLVSSRAGAGDGTIETTLFAADGTTELDRALAEDGTGLIEYGGIPGGTYYVRQRLVADQREAGQAYSVVIDQTCCDPFDGNEPNDAPGEATAILAEVGLGFPSVSVGAVDWYSLAVCPESPAVALDVVYDPADGALDGVLLAGDGATVLDEGTATETGESFAFQATEAGTVYLRVGGTDGFCVPYDVVAPEGLPGCPAP